MKQTQDFETNDISQITDALMRLQAVLKEACLSSAGIEISLSEKEFLEFWRIASEYSAYDIPSTGEGSYFGVKIRLAEPPQ